LALLDANIVVSVSNFVFILSAVQRTVLFKYLYAVITGDKSSHVSESELLPGFGEILFHTDMESGCSSMTWKYREQRIIDRLSVMPVPFSISAEYDIIDHNFQVLHLFNFELINVSSFREKILCLIQVVCCFCLSVCLHILTFTFGVYANYLYPIVPDLMFSFCNCHNHCSLQPCAFSSTLLNDSKLQFTFCDQSPHK